MTTVAVLCDPPQPGAVLPELVEGTPLSPEDAADLYTALLCDTVEAVDGSGGELLVNYRPAEAVGVDGDAEAIIREAIADVVDTDDARFEVQVGETFAGRVGNTATHLLETEELSSVGIIRPEVATFARTDIDSAAMKLRSCDVVVGPSTGGRVHYAAFGEPIDFTDCYAAPAVETLTNRCLDAGHDVEFLETKQSVRTPQELADAIVSVRAHDTAGELVPRHFAAWVDGMPYEVVADDDGLSLV